MTVCVMLMENQGVSRFSLFMYTIYIGNKNYSYWSLRPWVLLQALGIDFEEKLEHFEPIGSFDKFRRFSPSGKVPCLRDGKSVIWDSLAICEYAVSYTHLTLPTNREV